jgi:effector-binding domain-containing protein
MEEDKLMNYEIEIKAVEPIRAAVMRYKGVASEASKVFPNVFKAIKRYAVENNLTLELPFREVYIKSPGMLLKGNPNKYITEILFPLKEEI